jgi:hypothetical protein
VENLPALNQYDPFPTNSFTSSRDDGMPFHLTPAIFVPRALQGRRLKIISILRAEKRFNIPAIHDNTFPVSHSLLLGNHFFPYSSEC